MIQQRTEPPEEGQRSHCPAQNVGPGEPTDRRRRVADDDSTLETLSQRSRLEAPNSTQGGSLAVVDEKDERGDKRKSTWAGLSDWFVWEILAAILSAATLITLVVVLAKFDGKPQPAWEHISLNSVIPWLSTISKACIIFAVSEALGQLKWVWFAQKTQPMLNLRTFDSASRGFYGSAELIWTLRCRHFAIWGGLAVILALGFDPFTQNLIHYYPNMVEDASQQALLANASSYDTVGPPTAHAALVWVDPVLKANVYNSLLNNDQSRPWSIPQYACSSSNCTWDPIAALEARAVCSSVTGYLAMSCDSKVPENLTYAGQPNCTIMLPSNTTAWFIPYQYEYASISIAAVLPDQALVYKNATLPPIQMIAPYDFDPSVESPGEGKWQAMECSIESIVRSFQATVRDNVYREETLGVWTEGFFPWEKNWTNVPTGLYLEPPWGSDFGISPRSRFTLGSSAIMGITDFFNSRFFGQFFLQTLNSVVFKTREPAIYAPSDFIQAMSLGNITGCDVRSVEKLECAMKNVAQAMSKTFRDSAYVGANSDLSRANMTVGRAMTSVSYVQVRWAWIVLPALVWVLGAGTLAGTIWKTRRAQVPKWKNDPIPLLFLYQDGVDKRGVSLTKAYGTDDVGMRLYEDDKNMVLAST
ncbi:hypothetical protein Aspvir_006071 [Aspergillus viridinutans]|uniref:Uncharacterized protein n=1 Tax=Aspergillus viridinutans TaxID=75553 RepID=A0A9P3BWR5_ASPVI|nr:uncharacterized protein Aspvir_006071 [Aspergillus viridinutans]GIK02028.1 hypothetical protein Aspvir_006071 [Aspergillus viridinutans]